MNTKANELIQLAAAFARERHEGQVRKGIGQEPYFVHVEEVAALVSNFGGDEITICAAYLHDTVEDCPPTSFEEIEALFGLEVSRVVAEVTDDKTLDKKQRKLLQIQHASQKSSRAALLKLCDKVSNLSSITHSPPEGWSLERKQEYIDWASEVVKASPLLPEAARGLFKETKIQAIQSLENKT